MRKMLLLSVASGLAFASFVLTTYVHPELLCILMALVLFLVLAADLCLASIWGITKWRKDSFLWPVPALICLVSISSIYFVPPLGRFISDWRFQKQFREYSAVANNIRSGIISCETPCDGHGLTKGDNRPSRTKAILAVHCGDGGKAVMFLEDCDVPLLHVGYLFKEDSADCGALTREFYVRRITGSWYRFSDQPGL